jgi:Spy/CpxP family protein refolding chaperone
VNNWKVIPTIIFATVLIFGAGVFSGGILVDYVKQSHPRPVKRPPAAAQTNSAAATNPAAPAVRPFKPPEMLSKEFLQRLDGDLRLTPEQHEAAQKIIAEGQNSVRKAVQDARLEIREVLTPEQRKSFDELVKRPFHKPIFVTNAPAATLTNNVPAARTNAP